MCGGGRGVRGRPVLGGSLQAEGVRGEEMLVAEAEEVWGERADPWPQVLFELWSRKSPGMQLSFPLV